jgi:hypothetical protein
MISCRLKLQELPFLLAHKTVLLGNMHQNSVLSDRIKLETADHNDYQHLT